MDRSLPAVIATAAEDRALSERIGVPLAQLPNNYTDIEGIIKIAHEHGCDSIHPGYGFLSESDQFAQAVREHDLTFIGPQTDTLKIFGDKLRARDLAVDAQVSVAPGRVVRDATELEEFLKGSGGSGILKSRAGKKRQSVSVLAIYFTNSSLRSLAGGGGRGIRAVKLGDDLEDSFARCLGESKAFGASNSGLLIEQAITNAQHIEVQILADSHKNIIHLFDRECSLQRRHQKLVEVAPSSLPPPLKQKIFDDAIALAHASNYEGMGTFEFLVNDDGHFFMECNPRLQVEHTVTESITGIDLVECQFAVAEGAPLQEIIDQPPTSKGFSVQTRILAEKMDITSKKISPSCEPLSQFEPPSGHGI
ncbi:hypothetical protein TL16_g09292 [Triparma laevis f. inornata]|uniref:Pyruvate carboxylase n=1 Tax=Triparma laevis f. inornata TaxID=1714386 RepID=A0A9W7BAF2_9STRA|nr:hypothetical protein TL16_g09292 [Triparma laevis f. inornata]